MSCGCGSANCACGRSCRCGQLQRINSQAGGECNCGQSCNCGSSCRCGQVATLRSRRRRRNAEYGTLETIDEGSLNALRKEYKLGLKEITLSPDEDPAEALMRYNAASIREALERASQEPLEISGDQLSAADGEVQPEQEQEQEQEHSQLDQEQVQAQEYGNGTMLAAPVEQVAQEQEYLHAAPGANDTIVRELAAAREEFKQLYSLIQSLKGQLLRAEQSLNDCQFDATSSTSTTSTTTPATISTTPLPTAAPPSAAPEATSPRSNALQEEKSWERLLASKGYDTKYLIKPNEEQLQPIRPESSVSGGDYTYQELPPYDPDNKAKRASGNGTTTTTTSTSTTERSNAVAKLLNSLVPEEEVVVEEAVAGSDDAAAAAGADQLATMSGSTPTPYALRGKFVRRGVRTTRQAIRSSIDNSVEPWRRNYSQEQVLLTKLDRLIDVLNDLLRLQLQRQRSTSSSSSMSSNSISSGRRILSISRMPSKPIKRLRRRKQRRSSSTTEAPPKQRIHN